MKHFASENFWECYEKLPPTVKKFADKSFDTLKTDPSHPSLHFKKIGHYRSVRIGIHYRALAVEQTKDCFGSGLAIMPSMTNFLTIKPLIIFLDLPQGAPWPARPTPE